MNNLQRLKVILKASGWSQEELAHRLNVSFATVNSWVNQRSEPRAKANQRIEELYLDIVGAETIDEDRLSVAKLAAETLLIDPKSITTNKQTLDKLTLHLTYHTNTIEGSTMTLSDVQEVIFDHKILTNRTAIEQAEARNHQAALHWLLSQLTDNKRQLLINEELILGIHLRLMNGIMSDAGQYRKHTVRIMGSRVATANWVKIPSSVAKLTDNSHDMSSDIVAAMASFHAVFEQIHPFSDANGRTGRLIMLAQALNAGLISPLIVKERRYAYYKYLEVAQTMQDCSPLELFIAEAMQFTHTLLRPTSK